MDMDMGYSVCVCISHIRVWGGVMHYYVMVCLYKDIGLVYVCTSGCGEW